MLSLPDFRKKQIVLCFAGEGQKLSFKNDNMIITDFQENIILQATCHRIFAVWLIGGATLTTGILERSKKFGFSINMLSYYFRPYGVWSGVTEGNTVLRKKQYEYTGFGIARRLVNNKIINQIGLLKGMREKESELKEAITKLNQYAEQALKVDDLQSLLGIEGSATRLFFGWWYADMGWQFRRPRTKCDIINTTLDIGYTFLFNMIECMLNLYGFDLYQGVYHRQFYQRKSLVCDIVEPFRCIIDKQVKRAYSLKQLQEKDFREDRGQFFLKNDKQKEYSKWILPALLEHKEAIFTYVQSYYRCFIRDKPIEEYPMFNIYSPQLCL
jgi:CRISPR-associated protein Cas1